MMPSALTGLDQGEFTAGHELDRKWRVPKEMTGRRLSQEEAKSCWLRRGSANCCKHAGSNINQIEIARVTVHDASTGLLPRPVALPLFELFRQRDHLPIWLKHPAKSTQEFETPLLNSLEC